MAALTDEVLMAYADGVLDNDAAAHVEALLRQDPEARRRLEIFRVTGAPVAHEFDAALEVPQHLVDFVLQYKAPKATLLANRWMAKFSVLKDWLVPQTQTGWRFAAASAAALTVGTGAGWALHGALMEGPDQQELAAMTQGQILAKGPLQQVLETAPSNNDVRISGWLGDSTVMRTNFTFKNTSGSYCREYQMTVPASGHFAGLACRSAEGEWTVEVHLPAGATKAAPSPAGLVKLLDPVIERMMDGDALGRQEEEEAIAKGWK